MTCFNYSVLSFAIVHSLFFIVHCFHCFGIIATMFDKIYFALFPFPLTPFFSTSAYSARWLGCGGAQKIMDASRHAGSTPVSAQLRARSSADGLLSASPTGHTFKIICSKCFAFGEGGYEWFGAALGGVIALAVFLFFLRGESFVIILEELALPSLCLFALHWIGCAANACAAGLAVPPGYPALRHEPA